jgi:hypothetical protein
MSAFAASKEEAIPTRVFRAHTLFVSVRPDLLVPGGTFGKAASRKGPHDKQPAQANHLNARSNLKLQREAKVKPSL